MRTAEVARKTAETDVSLQLNLDGIGAATINTGVPFLNHMLELFAYHGCFDLEITCVGDIEVDAHHSTEDIAIALGRAFNNALGNRAGIKRYGTTILPMDESLILVAIDISGRGICDCRLDIPAEQIGNFDTELAEEFMVAFSRELGCALHVRKLAGVNSHHIIEGTFKGLGHALRDAVEIDPRRADEIPSTKGTIL